MYSDWLMVPRKNETQVQLNFFYSGENVFNICIQFFLYNICVFRYGKVNNIFFTVYCKLVSTFALILKCPWSHKGKKAEAAVNEWQPFRCSQFFLHSKMLLMHHDLLYFLQFIWIIMKLPILQHCIIRFCAVWR